MPLIFLCDLCERCDLCVKIRQILCIACQRAQGRGYCDPSMATEDFPIDLSALKPLKLDPSETTPTAEQKAILQHNIRLCRDAIVFFTAVADTKGLGGHTGGAYDTVPEVLIARAFIASGARPTFSVTSSYFGTPFVIPQLR